MIAPSHLSVSDAMEQVEAKYQVKLLENFPPLDTLLAFDVAHRPVDQIRPASPQVPPARRSCPAPSIKLLI